MPLLLLNAQNELSWLADDPSAPAAKTLADWLNGRDTSGATGGEAVRLTTADDPETLIDDLQRLQRIEVVFDDANDGRGFSIGRRLREMGFSGEIRATGCYLQDQLHYLSRCGFNGFALPADTQENAVVNRLKPFSIRYQALLDEAAPRTLTSQSPSPMAAGAIIE